MRVVLQKTLQFTLKEDENSLQIIYTPTIFFKEPNLSQAIDEVLQFTPPNIRRERVVIIIAISEASMLAKH